MELIEIAALYAAVNLLLIIVLSLRVVARRFSQQISLGTGGDEALEKRIRAHGNAVEYIPVLVICLILLALMIAPVWTLHVVGITGTLGRVLHAIGLSGTVLPARQVGTILTWLGCFAGIGLIIWQALT